MRHFLLSILFWVGVIGFSYTSAFATDVESLKKVAAIQTAQIENLKNMVKELTTANENLKKEIDTRFKNLSLTVGGTETYYFNGTVGGYEPRGTNIWNESAFTGFSCPPGMISAGADYWKSSGYFHRSYCRPLMIQDKGWRN